MATYPSIPFSLNSDASIKDGIVIDRAMSGVARGRNLYTAKKRVFQFRHKGLTTADKNTLETFYDSNRAAAVDVTWTDGTSRSVLLTSIKIDPWPNLSSGRLWDVSVNAEEV